MLTEGKIESKLLEIIAESGEGDTIDMVMFYLADRDIVRALVDASNRGVTMICFKIEKIQIGPQSNISPSSYKRIRKPSSRSTITKPTDKNAPN